jgi:4-amino-4-deoxy-L-arabinose transferase-like glycosyltransferase
MRREIRGHLPGPGVILFIGLCARLLWVAYVHPDPADGRFDDTVWYHGAAQYLARGEGYLNPFSGTPTAAWPPGYPAFLAGVFKLMGAGVAQTIGANVVVSLTTLALVYAIALVVADRRTALIAAIALSLWPGQVYFTSLTLSEPLFTMLFCAAVLALLLAARRTAGMHGAAGMRARLGLVAAFGGATALAALTRGQALLLLPFAAVCFVMAGHHWRTALACTLLATAAALAVIAPWTARNVRTLDSFVLISTNVGTNFWIGNSEAATGRMNIDAEHPPITERGSRSHGEWEAANDRLALREGLRWAIRHPLEELALAGVKIRAMFESDATALDWNSAYERDTFYASPELEDGLRRLANGFWFAALGFAAIGIAAAVRRGETDAPERAAHALFSALPALVLAWTAVHVLFFGDSRFHYPVVFAVAIVAARGIVAVYDVIASRASNPLRRYAEA